MSCPSPLALAPTALSPAFAAASLTALTGLAFAGFLLLRPWGDISGDPAAALEAFASPLWLLSHLLGAAAVMFLALRSIALRAAGIPSPAVCGVPADTVLTVVGTFGVVLYFGMEAFALHGLALSSGGPDPAILASHVEALRSEPVSLTMFLGGYLLVTAGVGLSLRSAAGRGPGVRIDRPVRQSQWALTVAVAGIVPHFFLPPVGRVLFGLAFFAVCLAHAAALRTWLRASDLGDPA
jgi:hypothetical protein